MAKRTASHARPTYAIPTDAEKLSGKLCFEPHNGFGGRDPDGDPWPFGYISTSPTPQPVFELRTFLEYEPAELVKLARRMAAANELLAALKAVVGWWEQDGGNMDEILKAAQAVIDKAEGG